MQKGPPFVDRDVFVRLLANIKTDTGKNYKDFDTIYTDMSRLVVAWLATTKPASIREIYNELGWLGSANGRAVHEAAKHWYFEFHSDRASKLNLNIVRGNMSKRSGKTQSLFDECINDIESAYKELGHNLGWRFLSVSKSVLNGPVKVALVTINPAGNEIPPDHPWPSCENGVSYIVERWGNTLPGQSKLQIQVQKLFEMLRGPLNYKDSYMDLMSQSLISHFIPFRSPRFEQLARQDESIEFGHALWKKILPVVHPQLIICLGRDVQEQIRSLIQSELSGKLVKSDTFPTGWGNYNAELDIFKNSEGNIRLLYLPHLSTWTLFTSDKCVENMPGIIDAAAGGL